MIATRFFIPAPRPGQVVRHRLEQQLHTGLNNKLVLVSAPAGSGKTTLVSSALKTADYKVAWVSLDENDAELQHFVGLLVAGLQKTLDTFGAASASLLASSQPVAADTLLTTLLNDLTLLEPTVVLVLDDLHAVDSSEVDEALAFLVEHQPHNLRLVIITREDPVLPLARLRARGELSEIRASDLRFTTEEAGEFLSTTMSLTLDQQQIQALEKRTEGWAAGLQLAALSLQGRDDSAGFIDAFTGSHRFVIDYLAEEVLARQPDELREFMLQTSVLEHFNAGLCNAVTASDDSEQCLRQLERQNQFLVPLDEQRQWYRYHHLFRDVLRAWLRQSETTIELLHQRASLWWEEQGFAHQAIDHALEAGDSNNASRIIEQHWPAMRKQEPESVFLGWMRKLPRDVIANSPVLCAHYGITLLAHDPDDAATWLDAAEAWLDKPVQQIVEQGGIVSNEEAYSSLPGLLAVGRAYHAGAIGDPAAIIHHADRALDLLAEDEAIWRGSAAVLQGLVQWSSGDLQAAAKAIKQGNASMQKGGEASGVISTSYLLANIHIAQGRRQEAGRICNRALSQVAELTVAPQGTADIYVTLALLALGRYQLDEARDYLQKADSLGDQAKLLESAHLWFVMQSLLEVMAGRHGNAADLLDEARAVKIPSPAPEFAPIDVWQARLDLLSGNLDAAARWVDANGLSVEDRPVFALEFSHLTLARLQIARLRQSYHVQHARQLQQLLSGLHALAEQQQRDGSLMEIHLLLALSHQVSGDESAAKVALLAALASPEAELQAYRLLIEDNASTAWLRNVASRIQVPQWVTSLYGNDSPAANTAAKSAHQQEHQPLIEPLSDREGEVLRMLQTELSGPEIAERLFVSLNTLRTHTKNIYGKLGVNNRRAAVRRSDELGLD